MVLYYGYTASEATAAWLVHARSDTLVVWAYGYEIGMKEESAAMDGTYWGYNGAPSFPLIEHGYSSWGTEGPSHPSPGGLGPSYNVAVAG